ncbi:MAG TPA: branched-chain amino acid ABC transporter permease, partial [Candidatus Competibacteraceae bacterium]|nr:branched-chain amino acid ABC transporter permease [Candidatus Competibacteraceae bacterium]
MLYREAGQFKSSYAADQQLFPIRQDRIGVILLLVVAFVVVPMVAGDYWFSAILIPFLIFALAALGLNLLTGYAGQLSLGSAAFMAVGAYAAYNFQLRIDGLPMVLSFALAGLTAAGVGILFGLPSLWIKGFYLAVATLAAQFFIVWCLTKFPWFSNHSSSGVISTQKITFFGYVVASPREKYLLVLTLVTVLALAAKNLVRSSTGRAWMAVRDMDVAAEVIGIRLMPTKLLAFAVSSFYCGVAGALYAFCYLGSVEPDGFSLDMSFRILFMIIIGGMGSIPVSYTHLTLPTSDRGAVSGGAASLKK